MRSYLSSIATLAAVAAMTGNVIAQNDECIGAIPVVQGVNGPYSNAAATTSFAWTCGSGGNDLWYLYSAPGAGSLTVDLCGAGFDTVIELFDGNLGCGSLTSLVCNDDSCGLQSGATVTVNSGDVIYIRVGGYNSATGSYPINVNGPLGAGQVVAAATAYGTGCPARSAVAVYEQFASTTFDLSNTSLMFIPNGNGSYTVLPGVGTWFAGFSNNLALGDDQCGPVTLPFAFPHSGGTAPAISVSSNGFLWLGSNTNAACCSGDSASFLSDPMGRIAPCWMDLAPNTGGGVYADLDTITGDFVVTWDGVPEYSANPPVTMQVALQASGIFEIRYQTMTNTTHQALAGYSMGGVPNDPGNSDFSGVVTQPIVTGTAATPISLAASARPLQGTAISMDTTDIPTGTALGATVLGFNQVNPGFDLTVIGMPGCFQYATLDKPLVFLVNGATGSTVLPIPLSPAFTGLHVFTQSATFTPGFNAFNMLTSNGVDLEIGNL